MHPILERAWRGLTENSAATSPDPEDPRLEGRTYAIPFEDVWRAATSLADGGLRGWRLAEADDEEGVIRAESTTLVFRFVDDVEIRIGLDPNGQTRVDMSSASRVGQADLGTNVRRIRRFFRALDRELERTRGSAPARPIPPSSDPVAEAAS